MITREALTAKLVAARLSFEEYLKLRNTVKILRLSGAPLTAEQEQKVKKFEAAVREYEQLLENGGAREHDNSSTRT